MKLWGGNYAGGPDARVLGVQPLVPVRPPAAGARRSPPRAPTCARWPLRRHPGRRTRHASTPGSAQVLARAAGRPALSRARRRGRAQLRRDAARRDRGRPGRPGPPRPQPQRAGGDGAAAVDPRRDRRPARGDRGAGRRRSSRRARAGADAVMPGYTHTRAAEPITFGHLGGRPRLGAGARPRAPARRAPARQRAAARLGRARGHGAAARPRGAGARPRASRRSPRTRSTR